MKFLCVVGEKYLQGEEYEIGKRKIEEGDEERSECGDKKNCAEIRDSSCLDKKEEGTGYEFRHSYDERKGVDLKDLWEQLFLFCCSNSLCCEVDQKDL